MVAILANTGPKSLFLGAALLLILWTPLLAQQRFRPRWAVTLAVLVFLSVALRTAWLCDDAFINFRTAEHFLNGRGLVFNVGERVQTYTAPAWMFLLTTLRGATGEFIVTTMLASIVISTVAVWLMARAASCWQAAVLAVLALSSSKAFLEFTTSGLENPLSFLLLAVFLTLYFREERGPWGLCLLSLVACLATLNRMDTLLLYLPLLIAAGLEVRTRPRAVLAIALGFAPLALWELFSLLYYGFPFPNTAYAKLNTGIPSYELAVQGLKYFRNSFAVDPLTLSLILVATTSAAFLRQRGYLPAIIGVLLYLAYVVKIGGSFISGRHFAAPLFVSVWLLARFLQFQSRRAWLTSAAVVTIGALMVSPTPTFFSGFHYGGNFGDAPLPSPWLHESGIEDSRYFYYRTTGLLRGGFWPSTGLSEKLWVRKVADEARRRGEKEARVVVISKGIGILGMLAGAQVHILDPVALAEPLLARLPVRRDMAWRIGHFERVIPEGYQRTLESGENRIVDPDLAAYYDVLSLIVHGELFSKRRMVEIFKLNLGTYDGLIDRDYFRYPPATVPPAER